MSFLSSKPTTVTAVFEAAIADVKVIQEKQNAKSIRLKEEQDIRQKEFDTKTKINTAFQADAAKESALAGNAIDNFATLFGIKRAD